MGTDNAARAGRHRNESFMMLFEHGKVDTRLIVEALRVAARDELHEVSIASLVFCKKNKVIVSLILSFRILKPRVIRSKAIVYEINLAANNRLDAGSFRGLVKFERAEKHAMIGHGDGFHPIRFRGTHKIGDAARAV